MPTNAPFPDSPNAPSPSHLPPLAQRIRADIHVLESELESPEHLRSPPRPVNSPYPISPCLKGLPSPAPLVFTPVPSRKSRCLNCEGEMTPDHQCQATDSNWEDIENEQCNVTDSESDWLKCHVCECLGRETSLVLRGSRCPSCGITAGLPSCLLCNCEPCKC